MRSKKMRHSALAAPCLALLAIGLASAYGCADAGPGEVDPGPDEVVAEASAELTAAQMVWGAAAADATLSAQAGGNNLVASDSAAKSPFRVSALNLSDMKGGSVRVSLPAAGGASNEIDCGSYQLSVAVEGFDKAAQAWVRLAEKDEAPVYLTPEVGPPTCHLSAYVALKDSAYTSLRVMAEGRYRFLTFPFPGPPVWNTARKNTTVTVQGAVVPDPLKKLSVSNVTFATTTSSPTGAAVGAKISNAGPLTATNVASSVSGSYLYCPPATSTNQSPYCVLEGRPCQGSFCPSGVSPSGSPVLPHRTPLRCHTGDASTGVIPSLPNTVAVYTLYNAPMTSGGLGCGPCKKDGRCADLSFTVRTNSLDENDPWDTWDLASGSVVVANGGVY